MATSWLPPTLRPEVHTRHPPNTTQVPTQPPARAHKRTQTAYRRQVYCTVQSVLRWSLSFLVVYLLRAPLGLIVYGRFYSKEQKSPRGYTLAPESQRRPFLVNSMIRLPDIAFAGKGRTSRSALRVLEDDQHNVIKGCV